MQYILTGFTHDLGFRVFAFECVGQDQERTEYTVRADLLLVRKYGIRLQELPLLCRGVLERRDSTDHQRVFTYAETDMRIRAEFCAAQVVEKRKPPRRPPSENVGAAWRRPQF